MIDAIIDEESMRKLIEVSMLEGVDYADVFYERSTDLAITVEGDKVEKVSGGIEAGVGIRVVYGGRTSYAYTNELTTKSLMETARVVCRAVKDQRRSNVTLNLEKTIPSIVFQVRRRPQDVPIADKLKIVKAANDAARGSGNNNDKACIRQIGVTYRDSVRDVVIANSFGRYCEDTRVQTLLTVNVTAGHNGVIQSGYESIGGTVGFELFDEFDVGEVSLKAAKRAVMLLGARHIEGGSMPVVISSEAGGTMIHEAIGHGLEADLAQQGLSVYSSRLGAQVASPVVTVIDDATLVGKRGSFRFDDEGTMSQKTVLVENGILKQYMYDITTAL